MRRSGGRSLRGNRGRQEIREIRRNSLSVAQPFRAACQELVFGCAAAEVRAPSVQIAKELLHSPQPCESDHQSARHVANEREPAATGSVSLLEECDRCAKTHVPAEVASTEALDLLISSSVRRPITTPLLSHRSNRRGPLAPDGSLLCPRRRSSPIAPARVRRGD